MQVFIAFRVEQVPPVGEEEETRRNLCPLTPGWVDDGSLGKTPAAEA